MKITYGQDLSRLCLSHLHCLRLSAATAISVHLADVRLQFVIAQYAEFLLAPDNGNRGVLLKIRIS